MVNRNLFKCHEAHLNAWHSTGVGGMETYHDNRWGQGETKSSLTFDWIVLRFDGSSNKCSKDKNVEIDVV